MNTSDLYGQYVKHMRRIADVKTSIAVLQWDEETYLPPGGASLRGQQIATLSELSHNLFVDEEFGRLLHELNSRNDLDFTRKKNVELSVEDYDKNKKYSAEFVRRLSETVSKSFHTWIDARKQNNFHIFQQPLEELVELKRQEADILGYKKTPYDALLNEYEKGATVEWLDKIFNDIRGPLRSILDQVMAMPQVDDGFLHRHFDKDAQWKLGLDVLKAIGFNFEKGRQDLSEHPFTVSFNANDVRITTRIADQDFTSMLSSCIHEGGHAMYEQGLVFDDFGLPSGEPCSLGIHESQSRLWENSVGRSQAFTDFIFPLIQEYFPSMAAISSREIYRANNKVRPSLIRTEADELTYHFHVMIRYELEKKLIAGELEVTDIPSFWNESYRNYLGVIVPDDKHGCLQDVHWSHGSFGYFPTYSLGSFYAAQFFASIEKLNPGIDKSIQKGHFNDINMWLNNHVYRFGRTFTSEELCNKSTGEALNLKYFLEYLAAKYRAVYGMN